MKGATESRGQPDPPGLTCPELPSLAPASKVPEAGRRSRLKLESGPQELCMEETITQARETHRPSHSSLEDSFMRMEIPGNSRACRPRDKEQNYL